MSEKPKGRFENSKDRAIIEKRLRDTEPGDVVTYDDLTTLLGRDVRKYCYHNLLAARKSLINESVFFDVHDGVGLSRLSNEHSVKCPQSYVKRATTAARTAMKCLQNIRFAELSDSAKKTHLVSSAVAGAMAMFGSAKAQRRIESKVTNDNKELAIGETLKLFGG